MHSITLTLHKVLQMSVALLLTLAWLVTPNSLVKTSQAQVVPLNGHPPFIDTLNTLEIETTLLETLLARSAAIDQQMNAIILEVQVTNQQISALNETIIAWQQAHPDTSPTPEIAQMITTRSTLEATAQNKQVKLQDLIGT